MNYPEWLDQELWKEYIKHRIRIKKPMTPFAEKLNIDKLSLIMKTTHLTQQTIMNNVIEMGWQGIYAPRLPPSTAPQQPYVDKAIEDDNDGTAKYRNVNSLVNMRGMP